MSETFFCNRSLEKDSSGESGPGMAAVPVASALVFTAATRPVRMSLCFQPDRPSTRSKRSRRMNASWLSKIGMPRSEFAATVSPLWIAQSKPAMPLLRLMLSPWTMMSSPDSAS